MLVFVILDLVLSFRISHIVVYEMCRGQPKFMGDNSAYLP